MAIARKLDLPTDEGCPPDPEPRFVTVLAEKWARQNEERGVKAHAVEDTRFRHSDAGKCSRYLAYKAAGIEQTNPMDLTGVWNTTIGTILHELWQEALQEQYPGAEIETTVQAFDGGSGHIDALIKHEGRTIVYELKTVGGYAFKAAIGKIRQGTPAEGPKLEHIVQVSLGGKAQDADEVVIGYLAKECLSVNVARGMPEWARFVAEWTFTRDQYEPIADDEIKRVEGILNLVDKGELAARKIPTVPGEIVDPSRGRWELHGPMAPDLGDDPRAAAALVDTGTTWHCQYCNFQDLCVQTQPGRIPVDMVVSLRGAM